MTTMFSIIVLLSVLCTWVSAQYGIIADLKPISLDETPIPLENVKVQSKFALSWTYTVPTSTQQAEEGSKFTLSYHATPTSTPLTLGSTADLSQFTFLVDFSLFSKEIARGYRLSFFSIVITDSTDTPDLDTNFDSETFSTLSCTWEVMSTTEYLPCKSIFPSPSPFLKGACGEGTENLPIDCILSNGNDKQDVRVSGDEADKNCLGTNAGEKPDVPVSCDLGTCENAGQCDLGFCVCSAEFAGDKCEKTSQCPVCVADNTLSCSPRAGICTCLYGWSGDSCETALTPDWPDQAHATTTIMAIAIMVISSLSVLF